MKKVTALPFMVRGDTKFFAPIGNCGVSPRHDLCRILLMPDATLTSLVR